MSVSIRKQDVIFVDVHGHRGNETIIADPIFFTMVINIIRNLPKAEGSKVKTVKWVRKMYSMIHSDTLPLTTALTLVEEISADFREEGVCHSYDNFISFEQGIYKEVQSIHG